MKLGPITVPKPARVTIRMSPDLKARLDRYAVLHSVSWKEEVDVETLIPHMLKAFLDADAAFRKAEKEATH